MRSRKSDNHVQIIFGILVILIVLLIIVNRNNKVVLNNNKDELVVKNIKVDNSINELKVVQARVETLGKMNSIFVKIKNNTKSEISESDLKLTIYDKENNVLVISNINKVDKFDIGEEREFQVSTNKDLSNASKYKVEKVI